MKKVFTLKKSKGFTLIELLIVVAIIASLASIVFASLKTSRKKARDASVQMTMSSMRAKADLEVDNLERYTKNLCNSSSEGGLESLVVGTKNAGALDTHCSMSNAIDEPNESWAFEALLPSGGTNWFCVDSTGYAGLKDSSSITASSEINFNAADTSCNS